MPAFGDLLIEPSSVPQGGLCAGSWHGIFRKMGKRRTIRQAPLEDTVLSTGAMN